MDEWLCESCLAHPAKYHFDDVILTGGSTRRHLCESCLRKLEEQTQWSDHAGLRSAVCQYCGAPAKILDGVRPFRKVMCCECAKKVYQQKL